MDVVLQVAHVLFQPQCLLFVTFGALVGVVLGAIPGLSGGLAITILLPVTFTMNQYLAIAFLVSIYVGSMSGSFIGSILLGIPGTPSSIATVYDGYEFTKKGDPVRALSAGVASNFIGTTPSLIIAMIASPIIAKFAVKMGPWEYFGLALCAIVLVIAFSKENFSKGFIATAFAILVATVGFAPLCGTPRFTFGNYYLTSGFSLISVLMGLFAGSTILLEYARNTKSEATSRIQVKHFKWPGKDLAGNVVNIIRSFLIGLWVGFLPGLGGAVSNMMAYAQAKNASKHPEKFGTGLIDGVIAPEVSNNASLGGALIPFISLGIPGDTTTALLLGALIIQGVQPGPLLQSTNPDIVYMVFLAALLGGLIVFLGEMVSMPLFPMLLKIPYHYLYPLILVVCFVGAYANSSSMFDVLMTIIFTLFGVLMAYLELPSSPFMLTFILASILENNFRKAVSYSSGNYFAFFTRPVSALFICLALFTVIWPYLRKLIKKSEVTA